MGDRASKHPSDGRRGDVTWGERLRAESATTRSGRVAERIHDERTRLPAVVSARAQEADHLVRGVEDRREPARPELETGVAVAHPVLPEIARSFPAQIDWTSAAFAAAFSAIPPGIETDCERTVIAPIVPAGPAAPAAPAAPGGLVAPAGPWPGGSWPRAKSDLRNERFATFAELTALSLIFGFVTAPNWSWAAPTLFLGTS